MFSTFSFKEQVRQEWDRSCSPPWLGPVCRQSYQLPPAQLCHCSETAVGGKAGADAEGWAQVVSPCAADVCFLKHKELGQQLPQVTQTEPKRLLRWRDSKPTKALSPSGAIFRLTMMLEV